MKTEIINKSQCLNDRTDHVTLYTNDSDDLLVVSRFAIINLTRGTTYTAVEQPISKAADYIRDTVASLKLRMLPKHTRIELEQTV